MSSSPEVLVATTTAAELFESICASDADLLLVLDGETTVIRAFDDGDFTVAGTPRIWLSTESEAWTDPDHEEVEQLTAWTARALDVLAAEGEPRLVCRGPLLVIPEELRRLRAHLDRAGDSWARALIDVPDVGCWYSAWMQKQGLAGVVVSEPAFRVIRTAGERATARLGGLTRADLARGYLGVVTDSAMLAFLDRTDAVSEADALARYVGVGELLHAAALRPYNRAPRVQRMVARLRGRTPADSASVPPQQQP